MSDEKFYEMLDLQGDLVRRVHEALEDLDLGYAISTHKSQGSTLPYLIYCLDNTHYVMLTRQQLYTGITRAKKKATFIFETKAFCTAVKTSKIRYVQTFLYHFLTGEFEEDNN